MRGQAVRIRKLLQTRVACSELCQLGETLTCAFPAGWMTWKLIGKRSARAATGILATAVAATVINDMAILKGTDLLLTSAPAGRMVLAAIVILKMKDWP